MRLNLKKPIIFFDLESTGTNPVNDRIVQISFIKVDLNGTETEGNYLVNPECHIPAEATEIHGITDEMVADKPTFKELAQTLANDFRGCDFGGYNSNRFDVPMLIEEMMRAGVNIGMSKSHFIDVQNIFFKKEPRTLVAAYKFYVDPKGFDGAHDAMNDVRATYQVLKAQLEKYKDDEEDPIQNDVEWLESYTKMQKNVDPMGCFVLNDKEEVCFNFGKHKGKPVAQVLREEPSFYAWMMNGQFARSTKAVITKIYVDIRK